MDKHELKSLIRTNIRTRSRTDKFPDSVNVDFLSNMVSKLLNDLNRDGKINKTPYFEVLTDKQLKEQKGVTNPAQIKNIVTWDESGLSEYNVVFRHSDLKEATTDEVEVLSQTEAENMEPEQIRENFKVIEGGKQ